MILKIEVNLKDIYTEGEEMSFSDTIKDHISYSIKQKVYEDFKNAALDEMLARVKSEFEISKKLEINKIVSDVINNSLIKKSERDKTMVTIKDYIEDKITTDYFSERNTAQDVLYSYIRKFTDQFEKDLKKASDTMSKELKERYDLLFASQIVAKLHENGMLKDDVAKLLIPNKEEG